MVLVPFGPWPQPECGKPFAPALMSREAQNSIHADRQGDGDLDTPAPISVCVMPLMPDFSCDARTSLYGRATVRSSGSIDVMVYPISLHGINKHQPARAALP